MMPVWLEIAIDLLGVFGMIWLFAEFWAVQKKRERDAIMARRAFMSMWKNDQK